MPLGAKLSFTAQIWSVATVTWEQSCSNITVVEVWTQWHCDPIYHPTANMASPLASYCSAICESALIMLIWSYLWAQYWWQFWRNERAEAVSAHPIDLGFNTGEQRGLIAEIQSLWLHQKAFREWRVWAFGCCLVLLGDVAALAHLCTACWEQVWTLSEPAPRLWLVQVWAQALERAEVCAWRGESKTEGAEQAVGWGSSSWSSSQTFPQVQYTLLPTLFSLWFLSIPCAKTERWFCPSTLALSPAELCKTLKSPPWEVQHE